MHFNNGFVKINSRGNGSVEFLRLSGSLHFEVHLLYLIIAIKVSDSISLLYLQPTLNIVMLHLNLYLVN